MFDWPRRNSAATSVDRGLYLLGVAGLTASIVVIFLAMRAVLEIGAFCAEGGPYEIETHCPEGVPFADDLGVSGPLRLRWVDGLARRAHRELVCGGTAAGLARTVPVARLELPRVRAVAPRQWRSGLEWLICGVVFVAMGGGPLLIGGRLGGVAPRRPGRASAIWLTAIGLAVVGGIGVAYLLVRAAAG